MTEIVPLPKEAILRVFADAKTQLDYIIGLNKLVHPDFNKIKKLNGYVKVHPETFNWICQQCIEWDKSNKVSAMHGGAWLNYGFSCDDSLVLWTDQKAEAEY